MIYDIAAFCLIISRSIDIRVTIFWMVSDLNSRKWQAVSLYNVNNFQLSERLKVKWLFLFVRTIEIPWLYWLLLNRKILTKARNGRPRHFAVSYWSTFRIPTTSLSTRPALFVASARYANGPRDRGSRNGSRILGSCSYFVGTCCEIDRRYIGKNVICAVSYPAIALKPISVESLFVYFKRYTGCSWVMWYGSELIQKRRDVCKIKSVFLV